MLELTFSTGEVRVLDIAPDLWGPAFEPLRDPRRSPRLPSTRSWALWVWPNGSDLSPEELFAQFTTVRSSAAPQLPATGTQ